MLARAVRSYLTLRSAAGFQLTDAGLHLRSFAAYSDARGRRLPQCPHLPSSGRDVEAQSYSELGVWAT
jgi:hypothetical protein